MLAIVEAAPSVAELGVVVGQEAGVRVIVIVDVAYWIVGVVLAIGGSVYCNKIWWTVRIILNNVMSFADDVVVI